MSIISSYLKSEFNCIEAKVLSWMQSFVRAVKCLDECLKQDWAEEKTVIFYLLYAPRVSGIFLRVSWNLSPNLGMKHKSTRYKAVLLQEKR